MTSSDAEQSGRERILARAVWTVSALRFMGDEVEHRQPDQRGRQCEADQKRDGTPRGSVHAPAHGGARPSSRSTAIVDGVSFPEHGPIPWAPGIQSLPTEWTQALTVSDCTIGQTHRRYRTNRMVRSDTRAEETA